jgi:phosphoglucosamine mutase
MRFGTDGIRGPAGLTPIDADGAEAVGRAALAWAREAGLDRVVIARDTRPSGPELVAAVCAGVIGAGGTAVDAGVLPSAGLATAVAAELGGAGVMVTASHNPAADNGFKVIGPGGYKPDDARTAWLEARLLEVPTAVAPGERVDGSEAALAAYQAAFARAAGPLSALQGRRVLVDLAHGAATATAPDLAASLGVDATFRARGDGTINDGVGSEHVDGLAAEVVAGGFAAGIAVDGDADRCVLVDEAGQVVDGDALAWLLARAAGAERVAVTVMSTAALEASLPGATVQRTPVGDRHLSLAIRDDGCELGAESSGHVLFDDGLPGGDGLLTGLRGLAAAWSVADGVRAAVAPFVPFPRALTKVRVQRRPPIADTPAIAEVVLQGESVLGEGRVFLRYSGTEPVLRVLVEGRDADRVAEVSATVTARMAEVLG